MKQLSIFVRQYSQRLLATAWLSVIIIACSDHVDPQPSVVNCQLSNGMNRPYPCEFTIEKLIFLGNDGSTLGEITPAMSTVNLSVAKAKINSISGSNGRATYDVKGIIRRQNAPSFTVSSGYILSYAFVDLTALQSDPRPVITSTQLFPMSIGSTQEISVELSFNYSTSGSSVNTEVVPRSFFIENDVTTTKFAILSTVPVRDKAEASIKISPIMVN